MNKLFSNKKQEKGQGLVEYAIILALVAIVVIGVMTVLGKKVCNTMNGVSNSLDGGSGSNCGSAAAQSPAAAANAAFAFHCANRGIASGITTTWASGDVVVYLQNDGLTYTRFANDPFLTTNANQVVTNYGTIPAGTTVTCP